MLLAKDPSPGSRSLSSGGALRRPVGSPPAPTRGEGRKQRSPLLFLIAILITAAIAAPVDAQTLTCRTGQASVAVAELMFGRKIGDRISVTQAAWAAFLDREVSPRFPDGLTVVDASGQWRDQTRNRVIHEPSKIVTLVLRDAARDQERIDQIVAAYKQRFRQQAVGVVIRPACVSF